MFSESSLKLIYFVGSERTAFDDSVVQATANPAEYARREEGGATEGCRLHEVGEIGEVGMSFCN